MSVPSFAAIDPWVLVITLAALVLPGAMLIGVANRSAERGLYGRSRFAGPADCKRLGLTLIGPNSILLGRAGSGLLGLPGQQFVLLAAPTRSGKGVGIVVPNLLHYEGSVVVLDIKGENFQLTGGWRQSRGHSVYKFDPYSQHGETHRWNPLAYVSDDAHRRVADLTALAALLYPEADPQHRFWVGQARNAFLALTLYAFDRKDYWAEFGDTAVQQPSLAGIHRLALGDGRPIADYLRQLRADPFVRDETRRALDGLLSQAGDTFASIIGSLLEPLNPWVDPQLAAATACNDFDLRDVRRLPMTIYVVIPPHRLAEARLLINVLFSQLINLNTRELPSAENGLQIPCLLLMDEFTAVGKIEILASAVAYMAGYNLRLLPIIQSVAQLDAVYGKEVARTLITNHAAQILFAPREHQDAKEYSEMLGDRSVSKATINRGRDRSVSTSEERRPLMLPQELKAMGKDRCVLMIEGMPDPIAARKIVYYRDPVFVRRLLPPIRVPRLTIGE